MKRETQPDNHGHADDIERRLIIAEHRASRNARALADMERRLERLQETERGSTWNSTKQ